MTIDNDPKVQYALHRIYQDYSDRVSVHAKAKSLLKFGRNQNVGSATTGYTLWFTGQDQAHETYMAANTNGITGISSSSGSDTMSVTIEGHTESGGNKTFVSQTKTLTGQTTATLDTALNRVSRVYITGSTANVGEIYVHESGTLTSGKPNTTTEIHLTVPATKSQSEKASTSISSIDYWIVTGFRGSLLEKASGFADVELQVRESGGVFRPREDVGCSDSHNGVFQFDPYLIIPPNADVRLVAISDSTSRDISGSIQGYLGIIQ